MLPFGLETYKGFADFISQNFVAITVVSVIVIILVFVAIFFLGSLDD